MDQCGILLFFLDQSYLWMGEAGLKVVNFGWFSLVAPPAVFLH